MEKASLKDMLNYAPEKYISDEEVEIVRNTFKYNPQLFGIIRKCFLPTFSDPLLPLEEMETDIFLQGKNWGMMPQEEVKALVVARQEAVQFVMSGLVKLKMLANIEGKDEAIVEANKKKDSTK